MTNPDTQVPVGQVDREAAAAIMPFEGVFETLEWGGVVYAKAAILCGNGDDHPTVQAFARHRISGFEAAAKRLDLRAEQYDKSVVGLRLGTAMFQTKMAGALREEAKMIRALSPSTTGAE